MVKRLYDGQETIKKIIEQTVDMVHLTRNVTAIKKLIQIHDILELNLSIQKNFKDEGEIWDFCALRDMNITRAEIVIYHHPDFNPVSSLIKYNNRLCGFLRIIAHKYEKSELLPMAEL